MVAKTKIKNEKEVLGWFKERRSYAWMVQKYLDKYNEETSVSMWSNFRAKKARELPQHEVEEYNLERRMTQNDDLVPWKVHEDHRYAYPVVMLRFESRRRVGEELPPYDLNRVTAYVKKLERDGTVVAYDRKTGFAEVPREPGDTDIIRRPARKTGKRRAVA